MQQTLSYSSSPSPTLISTITQTTRSPTRTRSTNTPTATPAIISVDYSCDPNRIMSPSAHSNGNYIREQKTAEGNASDGIYSMDKGTSSIQAYSSLFGDPVPPPEPEDYFGTAAFETIRAASLDIPSSEEDMLVTALALNTLVANDGRRRLFSNVPYTSRSTSRSNTQTNMLPMSIPRLKPPDIQILPNSSGGSSSEQLDSPNFTLLAPQDIVNKPDVYDCDYEEVSQASGHTFGQIPLSSNAEQDSQGTHRPMSETYSNPALDWYRPGAEHFAEFSRIPKLRPSSKMVMSIKHEEMPLSPIATMFQDSNGSSSGGEDHLMHKNNSLVPERSPVPIPSNIISGNQSSAMDMDIILSPKQYLQQQRELFCNVTERQLPVNYKIPYQNLTTPRSPSICQSQIPESINDMAMTSPEEDPRLHISSQGRAGEMSPVVIKDSISTGGDYRVGDARLHKKSSFTILSVRSPKSSLTHTPSATPVAQRRISVAPPVPTGRHASIQSTTTSSTVAVPQVRPRRKSLTTTRLPQLPSANMLTNQQPHDDSPRPSVQFNMSRRYSPSKLAMPKKGILQQRDSLTSSVDTYTPRSMRRGSMNMNSSPAISAPFGQRIKSLETLPLITDPYRSAIPRFHRSSVELDKETTIIPPGTLPRPLKPNPNPTRKQRGFLGIISKEENNSRIPPRSNWLSLDDLVLDARLSKSTLDPMRAQVRRRSSSTSPERRSSTQTASDRRSSNLSSITTSDFSFRRPILATLPTTTQRRKSVYLPATKLKSPRRQLNSSTDVKQQNKRAKIAKPTTLSPIIGTPNKDSGKDSPLHGAAYDAAHRDTPSDVSTRRDSISRIPVRSRQGSHQSSRANSPQKDFANLTVLSRRNSQTSNSRSPSQATIRSSVDARGVPSSILTPTRFSLSRPVSRGPPSRPNSRLTQTNDLAASSRANSRLSLRSSLRSTSNSPANISRNNRVTASMPNRRKSISASPKGLSAKGMRSRRMSLSPVKQGKQSPKRDNKEKPISIQRRNSRSRIPTSTTLKTLNGIKATSPSAKKQTPIDKSPAKLKTPQSSKGKKPSQVPSKKVVNKPQNKVESAKKKTSPKRKADLDGKRPVSKPQANSTAKKQPIKPKTPQVQKKEIGQSANKDKIVSKPSGTNGMPKPLVRTGSQQNTKKNIPENTTPKSKHTERVESGKDSTSEGINPLAVQVGNAVLQAAEALPAVRNEVNASTPASIKRQGSNMSTLVRMSSRLSLISNKKRVDSAQTRKVATVPELTHLNEGSSDQPTDANNSLGQVAASADNLQKNLEGIHKSITETSLNAHDNLTSPKTHENETGIVSESGASPSPSGITMVAKPFDSASRLDTADGSNAQQNSGEVQKSPLPPTQPIEASISVLNSAEVDAANGQISTHAVSAKPEIENTQGDHTVDFDHGKHVPISGEDFQVDNKRLSPDGQGGSTAGSGGPAKTSSQEFLKDDVGKSGYCRCCTTLCMRFRRSQCFRCCGLRKHRLHGSSDEQPVLSSARSSATTTTQLEVIDETKHKKKKSSCWPSLNCCKSCRKKQTKDDLAGKDTQISKMSVHPVQQTNNTVQPKQQGKCGLCMRKIFCCRSVNKVDPITGDETELRKCCFCIPCRRKRSSTDPKVAWRDRDPELGINPTDAAVLEGSSIAPSTTTAPPEDIRKAGCCKRFWLRLCCCCRKKPRRGSEARRQSIKAPPTSEETRRKLHVDLVEYASKMKGAIPVLPLYLAWFCAICNVIFPGLGTLLSGLFCLCVGIPRFSQFDSARARIGSFIINIIVAVSQFLTVLFCFVGWGWSIWWGTIMLRCARKLNKIKKVERLELEEEQRQAELAAAATTVRNEAEPTKT